MVCIRPMVKKPEFDLKAFGIDLHSQVFFSDSKTVRTVDKDVVQLDPASFRGICVRRAFYRGDNKDGGCEDTACKASFRVFYDGRQVDRIENYLPAIRDAFDDLHLISVMLVSLASRMLLQ